MSDCKPTRELYVCFLDDNIVYPFHKLFRAGFKHVFIIERTALGWTMLDPNRFELRFVPLPVTYRTHMMNEYIEMNPGVSIIQLEVYNHQDSFYPTMGFISCVGVIKYCLGVSWPLVLTPWQLWTKLLKSNIPHLKVINSWLAIDGSGTKT